MTVNQTAYLDLFEHWDHQHATQESIKNELHIKGYPHEQVEEILSLYKKKKLQERTQKGLWLIGIGLIIGFLSCVFTLMELLPDLRNFILYGLTSIAILFVIIGGYFVFE
ncbi:MAG: hypothetical protein KA198_05550 [Chitinophagaceae bacterium]|nr:hypothetical protein [Chitinophagaceae bacterium]